MPVPYGQSTKKDLMMQNGSRGNAGKVDKISENMRVFLRIRPYLEHEKSQLESKDFDVNRSAIEFDESGEVLVMDETCLTKKPTVAYKVRKQYGTDSFDEVFWSFGEDPPKRWDDDIRHNHRSQSYIFRTINRKNTSSAVDSLYSGYNHCFITYGAVNSGKTHTMFGSTNEPGLAPRFVEKIVSKIPAIERKYSEESLEVKVSISFARVHKEQLEDCLSRETLAKSDFERITTMECRSEQQLQVVLSKMQKLRKPSSKDVGGKDNSSHMIVTINLLQESKFESTKETCRGEKVSVSHRLESSLTLVDLGTATRSEHESPQDVRLVSQAPQAIARVFHSLSLNATTKTSIPYRDSILTYYLQDCLGGNCVTTVICCIDPYYKHHNDSVLSIDTTKKLRNITTTVTANVDKTLSELRTLNQEKVVVATKIEKMTGAALRVKTVLAERQHAINRLDSEKKKIQKQLRYERNMQEMMDQFCKESKLCFSALRSYRRRLLSIYDTAIKSARADRSSTRKLIAGLKQKISELEKLEIDKSNRLSDLTVRVNTAAKMSGFSGLDLSRQVSPKAAKSLAVSDSEFKSTAKTIISGITQAESLISERRESHQQCSSFETEIISATVEMNKIETDIKSMKKEVSSIEQHCKDLCNTILTESSGGDSTHIDPTVNGLVALKQMLSDVEHKQDFDDLQQQESLVREGIQNSNLKFRNSLPNINSTFQRIARATAESLQEVKELQDLKTETIKIKEDTESLQENLYKAQESAAAKEGELEALKLAYQAALEEARWRRQQESEEKARERQYEEDRKKREDELALAKVKAAAEIAAQQSKAPPPAPKKGEGGCCVVS